MIILTIFLCLQLFVHLQRRVLTFGVSQVGRQLGWEHSCNDNFSNNVSLECVCRPMCPGKRSNPYAWKFSLGGVPSLKTFIICARIFTHRGFRLVQVDLLN